QGDGELRRRVERQLRGRGAYRRASLLQVLRVPPRRGGGQRFDERSATGEPRRRVARQRLLERLTVVRGHELQVGVAVQPGLAHLLGHVAVERQPAGEAFAEDQGQAVLVAGRRVLVVERLGRGVAERHLVERLPGREPRQFYQAEVGDAQFAAH